MPKILIADDSRFQVQVLSNDLVRQGHELVIAMDAMQAFMMAVRNLPDAIILDINMPGGSGLQVLKRLKASIKTSHIPVLVVSSTEMTAESIVRLGAADFLHKPVDPDQMSAALTRILAPTANPAANPAAKSH